MAISNVATEAPQWSPQRSSRDGATVDRFIVHHADNTSVDATLNLFTGDRQVSAHYALGNGRVVPAVPETERAWTSGSYEDDSRAVTVEVSNSRAGEPWPVADIEFNNLARLIADVATRYGFPIDDDHVLTHQELWTRFGRSYPTACPGDLQRRKPELLELARSYQKPAAPSPAHEIVTSEEDAMKLFRWNNKHVVGIAQAEIFHVPNPAVLAELTPVYGAFADVDDARLDSILAARSIPWAAVGVCLNGKGYGKYGRHWSREEAEGDDARAKEALTLAEVKKIAEKVQAA